MFNYDDEVCKSIIIKANVVSIINFLASLNNKKHPYSYKILEYFPIKKKLPYIPKIYELRNLTLEVENDIVVFGDSDEKIYDDKTRVLIGFCLNSIINVGFQGGDHITFSFDEGYIQIYY